MSAAIAVREAGPADLAALVALRTIMWPDEPDHRERLTALLTCPTGDALTLVALAGDVPIGFADAALRRDYVNGCDTSPVAFVEGVYVDPRYRNRGVARALVERIAAWGVSAGCTELASDALLDNVASHRFHAAIGFVETERVVFFRRSLAP